MCTPIDNGYRMEDNIEITHEQIRKNQVSKKHLAELRGSPMDAIDGAHIRHSLHELANSIQKMGSPAFINPIVDERLKEKGKLILFGTSKIFLAVGAIATVAYNLYNYLFY
jgi:hypothetical protein